MKTIVFLASKFMELVSVPTELNLADIFTKPLPTAQFQLLRAKILGLGESTTELDEHVQFIELRGVELEPQMGKNAEEIIG